MEKLQTDVPSVLEYAWLITRDVVCQGTEHTDVGTTGPHDITDEQTARLITGEGYEFKMYDDDGNLYYEGRCLSNDHFGPMDDFGEENAGCTEIRYRQDNGKWETL